MPYSFSPSTLSLLKDCHRCFWMQFNKGIKRPQGPFSSLPNGMDKILKAHFDSFRERGVLPPELATLTDVRLFNDTALLETWRTNFKGIQWRDEQGNLFRGAVDDLLQKGSKLIVLDYKTRGFPLKDETPEYYQNQLDIYTFLLRKNGYETEDFAYLLFYYPNKVNPHGDVVFHTELVKMDVSVKNTEFIFAEALRVLAAEMPASGDCAFCAYCTKK